MYYTLRPRIPDTWQGAFQDYQRKVARRISVVAACAALLIMPTFQTIEYLFYGSELAGLHTALWRLPVYVVSLTILALGWYQPEGDWPRPMLQLFAVSLLLMAAGIFAQTQLDSDASHYAGQGLIISIAAISITATRGLRDLPLIYGLPLLFLSVLLLINGAPLDQALAHLIYPAMMMVVACIIAELLYQGNVASFLAAQQLRQSAMTDPLTGLLNRRAMGEELTIAQARATRHSRPYALIMADLDHFKRINDEHGHYVGDEVLVELAHRLKQSVRVEDRVARWGGEEFLLLIQEVDDDTAFPIAEKLRRAVATTVFVTSAGELKITVSLGLAIYREASQTEALIAQADQALYQAKEKGRDRIEAA